MPGKMGKKSNDGDELKRRKEYEKAYANYKGAAKPMKVDVKRKNTLSALLKMKPTQPKRPGGR
jgi:hypothetical protein